MGDFVHDDRHRFSYELRPDAALDAALRDLARSLEAAGMLLPGATSAPRFHPHLTLLRASVAHEAAVAAAARATPLDVTFDAVGTFGGGRIVWVASGDPVRAEAARAAALAMLEPTAVDPLVTGRPWTPHVTLAYAVPQEHQASALARVEARLPLNGRWESAQCWDLDVRPTRLVERAEVR